MLLPKISSSAGVSPVDSRGTVGDGMPALRLLKPRGSPALGANTGLQADLADRSLKVFAPGDSTPSSLEQPGRGRTLLRPLQADVGRPAPLRSVSPPPRPDRLAPLENPSSGNLPILPNRLDFAAALQQKSLERIRDHNARARARRHEEDARRSEENFQRQERAQKIQPQIEAHRRELARKAANVYRKDRQGKQLHEQEKLEFAAAQREKKRRYMTPETIRLAQKVPPEFARGRHLPPLQDPPRRAPSETPSPIGSCDAPRGRRVEATLVDGRRRSSQKRMQQTPPRPFPKCERLPWSTEYYASCILPDVGDDCWTNIYRPFACNHRLESETPTLKQNLPDASEEIPLEEMACVGDIPVDEHPNSQGDLANLDKIVAENGQAIEPNPQSNNHEADFDEKLPTETNAICEEENNREIDTSDGVHGEGREACEGRIQETTGEEHSRDDACTDNVPKELELTLNGGENNGQIDCCENELG